MFCRWNAVAGVAVVLAGSVLPPEAEAQIMLRGRARNLIANAAGIGVQVGPIGVAPYGYGVPPRLIVISPLGVRSVYGASPYLPLPLPRTAARPFLPTADDSANALPTEGELRAMGDSDLLNAVASLAARLDADLNQFTTAATWQNYLRLPDDALPPPQGNRVVLGVASLIETLNRFESTVANPEYVQISGLPSFAAMHAALKETVRRFGGVEQPLAAASTSGTFVPPNTIPPNAVMSDVTATSAPPQVPAIPRPDSPLARTDRPQLQTPSIEMQNLQASTPRSQARKPATPSTAEQPAASSAEELPNPPPSLVAPQNASASEHSILSR